MRTFLSLALFVLISTANAYSCSCNTRKPFMEVAPDADLVVFGKVTKHLKSKVINGKKIPMGVVIEVIEIFDGKEERTSIRVWGDNGYTCRRYLSKFRKNSQWVLALKSSGNSRAHRGEKQTDYFLSVCGEHAVEFMYRLSFFGRITEEEHFRTLENGKSVKVDEDMSMEEFRTAYNKIKK